MKTKSAWLIENRSTQRPEFFDGHPYEGFGDASEAVKFASPDAAHETLRRLRNLPKPYWDRAMVTQHEFEEDVDVRDGPLDAIYGAKPNPADERLKRVLAALAGLLTAATNIDGELVNPDPDERVAVRQLDEAMEVAEEVLRDNCPDCGGGGWIQERECCGERTSEDGECCGNARETESPCITCNPQCLPGGG